MACSSVGAPQRYRCFAGPDRVEGAGLRPPDGRVMFPEIEQGPAGCFQDLMASTAMNVLVVDTETTGVSEPDGEPGRLVQLAWVRLDADGAEREARSWLVRPDGFDIPASTTAVHGITTEQARTQGVALPVVLAALAEAAAGVDAVVAHNADFDRAVIAAEARRLGRPDPLAGRPWICTMRLGTPVCRIPRSGGWKYPRLEELYRHLFGTTYPSAHDALADARATARCYRALLQEERGDPADHPGEAAPPVLTEEQQRALDAMTRFLYGEAPAFILLGAAGTGKTTLLHYLVQRAHRQGRNVCLMAPTGRAARIIARRTGCEAHTIHSHIYNYKGTHTEEEDVEAGVKILFGLRPLKDPPGTLYVVDEASMVSDHVVKDEGLLRFGSGRLLTDLMMFAALHDRRRGNQIVFVGDPAQLPPVGSPESPALNPGRLAERLGADVEAFELTTVLRQQEGSGILQTAHRLREQIRSGDYAALRIGGEEAGIETIPDDAIVERYEQATRQDRDTAIIITRTNREAHALNQSIRQARFGQVPWLVEGDRLIVVQNNPLHDVYNGDFVDVVTVSPETIVRRPVKDVTLTWREVTIRHLEHRRLITAYLLENVLTTEEGRLSSRMLQALLIDFRKRHEKLKTGTREFEETLRQDSFVQALQLRHGYALTCHKAQGGEWPEAIVVFDGRDRGWDNENYFRWTYTAITRARRSLLVVRPPAHTATSDLSWSETTRAEPVSASSVADGMNPERLLARAGISLGEIQDMPYRRRIICTRDGCSARVDLIYNARHVITAVQPVGPGDALAQEVVRILEPLRGTVLEQAAGEADAPDPFVPPPDFFEGQPHLAAFYERMCALLEGTDIFIEAITHYPWMERYTFRRRGERAEINFWYNGKGRFTKASPVHPTTLARDIYDRWSESSET
ncbi:MAG: hypothetical protein D6685_15635 [Bacteroidetes bacterium]|nr:MAG: hypothetical protein D6685_15635 [Bacteroidota bacterium]